VIAEIVVELSDSRTGDNHNAQRPGDEQAFVLGAVVDPRQIMEEDSPAVPVIGPKPDHSASSDSHAFDRRGLLYSSLSARATLFRITGNHQPAAILSVKVQKPVKVSVVQSASLVAPKDSAGGRGLKSWLVP
jgi:hypothetical protein